MAHNSNAACQLLMQHRKAGIQRGIEIQKITAKHQWVTILRSKLLGLHAIERPDRTFHEHVLADHDSIRTDDRVGDLLGDHELHGHLSGDVPIDALAGEGRPPLPPNHLCCAPLLSAVRCGSAVQGRSGGSRPRPGCTGRGATCQGLAACPPPPFKPSTDRLGRHKERSSFLGHAMPWMWCQDQPRNPVAFTA